MGLRINNNINSINAGRQLQLSTNMLSKSLERLSSGLRINKGADDPAGLTISEKLRGQIVGLKQGIENSQAAVNLIGTAECGLNEMNTLLRSIKALAVGAASEGTMDTEQVEANQAEIDSAVNSINRIANTTKYADKYLLNGKQAFETSGVGASFSSVNVYRAEFGSNTNLTVNYDITTGASTAHVANIIGTSTAGANVIQITGATGSEQISIGTGASMTTVRDAINAVKDNTGVSASITGGQVDLHSMEFGEDQTAKLEVISGTDFTEGNSEGVNIAGTINGASAVGTGLELSVDNSAFSGKLNFTSTAGSDTATTGSFIVTAQGLLFQLGGQANPNEQESFGIQQVNAYNLGVDNGRLSSIKTGGDSDLKTDPENTVKIIDEAINDVSSLRARLGAFQVNTLETNINSLGVAVENITAAESRIRDVDFASEAANFTKSQILVQAGTAIASQANISSKNVLQLLM